MNVNVDTKVKNIIMITLFLISMSFMACDVIPDVPIPTTGTEIPDGTTYVNNPDDAERMLLVLAAPSINNDYYADDFEEIIDFMIDYANTIMHHDNVIVLADAATLPYLEDELPEDVLLQANVEDIWMRDFTTIIPNRMIQFAYGSSYLPTWIAAATQWSFVNFTNQHELDYQYTDWILDGGNVVDNNNNMAVVTRRFLEDNGINKAQGKNLLKNKLGVEHVAIIPYDDEVMGHADGMVMFVDDNVLLVNQYEEPFRSLVIDELTASLPGVTIVEVEVAYDEGVFDGFASACGINLNATVTHNHIYVPNYTTATNDDAIATITANTTKSVKTVDGQNVCHMGGSVRCLTWQLTGENARKLIEAAR